MKAPHPLLVVALALAHCCVPAAAFAGPRDDLLRLVPDDYTFCVVVQNLRGRGKSGGDGSWLKGFTESPLIKQMQTSPEAKKVQAAIESIFKGLDVSPEQIRDDILGDAVIFAYRKGLPGQQDKDDGIILVHARDDKLLARIVDRINELQIKGGEVKAVDPVGKERQYFRRVKAVETEKADYYALRGNKLLFSGSEDLLKAMLAKLDRGDTAEPLLAKRMKALGINDSPLATLINPRAFDADLAESAKTGKGSEQAFVKEFGRYWKAVDGLAVSMDFSPSIEIALSINVRMQAVPAAAVKHFAEAGKMSPLWSRIPDDALFAFVGRVHLESLTAMLGALLTQPDRAKVLEAISEATRAFSEMDDFGPIARGLGPDVGIWVTRPDSADKTWVPQGMLAVKTADNQDGKLAEHTAVRGLDFLARLACVSNKELRVRTEKQGDIEVRYLTHQSAFPPGFRPCFASKGGYILVAGSPQTIGRFEPPTASATDAEEVPILRISVSGWRKYLKDHGRDLVDYIATAKKVEPAVLNSTIESLMPLTEGLDRIEIVQRSAPGRVTVALRFKEARK